MLDRVLSSTSGRTRTSYFIHASKSNRLVVLVADLHVAAEKMFAR